MANPVSDALKAHARAWVRGALAAGWACALLAHYGSSHTSRMMWLVATALCAVVVVFAAIPLIWEDDVTGRRPPFWPTFGYVFPFAMLAALPKFGVSWIAPALSAAAALAITARMQGPAKPPPPPAARTGLDLDDIFILLLLPAFALLIAVTGFMTARADRRSEPFLNAAEFQPLPGCPREVAVDDVLPMRCIDGRYMIRQATVAYRYRLPRPRKGTDWLRIGDDAAMIDCNRYGCGVIQVRPFVLPSRQDARPRPPL